MSKSQEGQNKGVCVAGEADVTGLCKGQDNATGVWHLSLRVRTMLFNVQGM